MVDFSKQSPIDTAAAASNPAGPSGLRQTAQRIEDGQLLYAGGQTGLQPWRPEQSWLETARTWYTGANSEGTENGWNSDFWQQSWANIDNFYERSRQQGRGSVFFTMFDHENATGVAMWDDPDGRFEFGDVFVDGRPAKDPTGRRANVYKDYDKATADVMMGEFMLTREEKISAFADPDREERMAREVDERRRAWSDQAKYAPEAERYETDVKEQKETFTKGLLDDIGSFAAGAGATTTASAGLAAAASALGLSWWSGPGALVAAAIAGGTAAWMNKDQMAGLASEAYVRTERAWEADHNVLTTMGSAVGNAAMVAATAAQPLRNLHQGAHDIFQRGEGGWGDGEAGFYRVNSEGDRVVGAGWQGLDIVLAIGDGMLQFSSPAAARLYQFTMGAAITGGINDQIMGATFNESRGVYDRFDSTGERMSALGATTIDVAQLGMARLLGSAAANARAATTGQGATGADRLSRWFAERGDDLAGLGTSRGFAPGATSFETLNGIRFGLDDSLNVVGSRMTLEALVPSEFMRWLPTTWKARRLALDAGRSAPTRDDLYAAAWEMTTKGTRFNNAIINGYAEGSEEFVQANLEAWSVGETATLEEMVSATLYGAAGGAGMSLGIINTRPQGEAFNKRRAYALETLRLGRAPDEAEFDERWRNASEMDKRRMYTLRPSEQREMNQVLDLNAERMATDATYNSVVGVANLSNLSVNAFEAAHKKAAAQGQGSLVLLPMLAGTVVLPGGKVELPQYAANHAVMSAHQVGLELAGIAKGMQAQAKEQEKAQKKLEEDLSALQGVAGNVAADERAALQERIDEHKLRIKDINSALAAADQITNAYRGWLNRFRAETSLDRRREMILQVNNMLRRAGNGSWQNRDSDGNVLPITPEEQEHIRRAVELHVGRHPFLNTGSLGIYVPQVGVEMTENNIHSTMYIHHSTLKAPNADHDGDTGVVMHEKYLPPEERRDARRGTRYVEQVKDEKGRTKTKPVVDMPDNEARYIRLFSEAMAEGWASLPARMAHGALLRLNKRLYETLSEEHYGPIPDEILKTILGDFKQNIQKNSPKAREKLLYDLLNADQFATSNLLAMVEQDNNLKGVPFIPWIMETVNTAFDRLQRDLATQIQTDPTAILSAEPDPAMAEVSAAFMSRIAVQDAATAGQQLMATLDPTRAGQQLHYSALYRALTLVGERGTRDSLTTPEQEALVAEYARLGSGIVMSELDMTLGKDSIERNVRTFLDSILAEYAKDLPAAPRPELRLLLANMQVPDIRPMKEGGYSIEVGTTSLAQLLLRKALEIEEQKLTGAPDDAAAVLRIKKLKTLAYPKKDGHSYTASTVLVELFGAENLYDLVGDASMFLGREMTLGQLKKMVTGMSKEQRSHLFHNLRRSSAYIKDDAAKDPPWTTDQVMAGQVNAFAIVLDAVKTSVDTDAAAMAQRDATLSGNFRKGLDRLRNMIDQHQSATKGLPAGRDTRSRIVVLRDMLEKNPQLVNRISALIPEASALGVFQVLDNGEVRQANWLEEVLTMQDSAKAEVIYYVQTKLAEFNQMGGTVSMDTEDASGRTLASRGTVRYDQIKSRFLQTVYYLSKDPTQLELQRFLRAATNASSLEALFKDINAEPDWLNDRERLLPYHDDVGLFETRPEDIWQDQLPYALQREAIEQFGTSMKMLEDTAFEQAQIASANQADVQGMLAVARGDMSDARYVSMYRRLGELIKHRQKFPDAVGPRARDQLMELFTEALIRLHDKGKIDEAARGFGESLVVLDAFGWKGALAHETDAMTAYDWEDVVTNLTKLVNGPLRLQLDDGSILTLDMSTTEGALELLADPRTQQFAMSVLLPTVRDVNTNGVLQTYRDTGRRGEDANSIEAMLSRDAFRKAFFAEGGSRVEQAWRYIGALESNMRAEALHSSQADMDDYIARNDAAHHPIQNMIDDFLVAYTHGPKWKASDKRKLRDKLVVDVADAIKAMANVDPAVHVSLRERVLITLQKQFEGSAEDFTEFLSMDPKEREFYKIRLANFITSGFNRELAEIDRLRQMELDQTQDPALRAAIVEKYMKMEEAALERQQEFDTQFEADPLKALRAAGVLSNAVSSTVNSMRLTGNPNVDLLRKVQILNILGKQNRTNRFRTKADIELYHKVRRIIYSDSMNLFRDAKLPGDVKEIDDITLEEWNTLGGWAAATTISDMTSRSGSEVALLPLVLGKDGDLIRKYYDVSYGYLVDNFFNQDVLTAAKKLSAQANAQQPVTEKEMLRKFENGLFGKGNLGLWSDRVPIESMKMRRVVDTASTGAAIQTEGNDPKELAAYVAAGRVSTKLPDKDEHHSVFEVKGRPLGELLRDLPPNDEMKLSQHFFSSISLVPEQGATGIEPEDLDLWYHFLENEFNDEVWNSPYKVLNMQVLRDRLAELEAKYGSGITFDLKIEYVDVDKMPGGEREWANNIFFVGVGREGYRTSTFGAIAALYFGANGLSKLGQQNPLDAATKKGKRWRALVTTPLQDVEALEAAGASIADILRAKAHTMFLQHYPTGDLLDEDLPALYELMKMRHVIVGENAEGEKEVWWPQRYIELQTLGEPIPLTKVSLVPLNDSIAQQLHSGKGYGGLRTRVTQRELNLQDIRPFASLDAARLRDLGLTRLGDKAEVWDSPVTQVGVQQHASLIREDEDRRNSIQQRVQRWLAHREGVRSHRALSERTDSDSSPRAINNRNFKTLSKLLSPNVISSVMRKMGVPFADFETDHSSTNQVILKKLRKQLMKANSSAVLWFHDHESGSEPGRGILGRQAVEEDFQSLGKNMPTYGDVVAINVSSIERMNTGGDPVKAAKKVIRSYAQYGLHVVLVVDNGRRDTLNELYEWLDAGAIGYRSVSGSPNFYAPIDEDPQYGETRRALNSTLTSTQVYDTDGVSIGMVTNELITGLSENGGAADLAFDPGWRRVVANVIPSRVLATGSAGDDKRYSFAYPAAGDARSWEILRERLLPVLQTEEGLDHLTRLASDYKFGSKKDGTPKAAGNPPGVPLYREVETTGERIPGVLDAREALIQLRNILEAGDQPLEAGRYLQLGSFIPSIGPGDQILLNRIGFLPPDMLRMKEMLDAPAGENKGKPGAQPLGIAIAPAKLDKNATIGPRFRVKRVKTTPRGLTVVGEADLSGYAKTIIEGTGFKMGVVPLPSSMRFKDIVIRAGRAAGMRLTRIASETSVIGKEATPLLADNFSDAFMFSGINFERDLMEFFYGDSVFQDSSEDYARKWDSLKELLDEWSHYDHGMTAEDLSRALDKDAGHLPLQNTLNAFGPRLLGPDWQDINLVPSAPSSQVNSRIGLALLATLAAPNVRLQHVLGTPGLVTLSSHEEGLGVRQLPKLLTDALADPTYPNVRKHLIGRINGVMPDHPTIPGKKVYWFDEQLNFHAIIEEQSKDKKGNFVWQDREVVGQLQIQLPIVNDVTGDTLAMAALTPDLTMSPHVVNVQNAAEGGYLVPRAGAREQANAIDNLPSRTDEIFGDNEILRFETGQGSVVWDMLTRTLQSDPSYSPWERKLPLEEKHRAECDLKVRYYTKEIDKPDNSPDWPSDRKDEAIKAADSMLEFLGLTVPSIAANRAEIDYLVRQWYGAPAASNADQAEAAKISAEEYIQAVKAMRQNLANGMHPLHSADVPLEHVMFWRKVYEAQRTRPMEDRWAPAREEKVEGGEVRQVRATDWADWVRTVMGQALESSEAIDSIFANALDGFYHTYQGASSDFLTTALSLDEKKQARLFNPDVNRTYLSVDPDRDALFSNPVIIDSQEVTYEALAGHSPEFTERAARTAEVSPRAKRRERAAEFRRKNNITNQKPTTVREYARNGFTFQESKRQTSELLTGMVNLSISMRLANPALYVSAMVEVPFRNILERSANLLNGTYTGIGAGAVGKAAEKFGETKVGQAMGSPTPRYSANDLALIEGLVDQLGESNLLLGELFQEMVYANPMQAKTGIGRGLEGLATKVARFSSDPRWGMRANSVARRYVEAALEYLDDTNSTITVPQFVKLMKDDPLWLKKHSGEGFNAHRSGVNRVAQVRATRPTVASKAIMSPLDAMTQSGSGFLNGAGHLLKIPFLFTRFNLNTLMTFTGLDGLDQALAMFMDGRHSPQLIKRMNALTRGTAYDKESAPRMDMSDVLQGIDLSRVFVRGAVTQTGLMAAALMAAGRGLGGEDEEEKRRRKLSKYLNIPLIRDPREAQNDFRFKDAVFLDNVPVLDTYFHRDDIDRSVVVPHWVMRQFLSPVLGTMRFFQTGDLGEIKAGFFDAAAAIPNSALNLWRQAEVTAQVLEAAAADASLDPQKDQQVNQFIINTVGMWEKALIENQFVNWVLQALDPVDRNPWLIPRTAEENTGELDRLQGSDLPQETNALVDIVTEGDNGQDPQIRKAYLQREPKSAQLHAYAESNRTFAFLASLVTGGTSSSFLRGNMVPKGREAIGDEATKSELEAAVMAAFEAQGGQPARTHREILQMLRDRETAAGNFWDNEALNEQATAIFEAEQKMQFRSSLFDKEAQAIVDNDLETGMFKSLQAGLVKFGDPIMAGFSASDELRDEIAREWATELVEEGIALGLTQDAAKWRMERFWWGDEREGWVGLRELLYSTKIPKSGDTEYLQQNVTYVIGPDGKPWATPFEKANLLGAVIPMPNQLVDPGPGLALDSRGNVIDLTRNINTGMAGLLQTPQEPEKFEPNDDILEEVKSKDFGDKDPTSTKFKRWPRRSYGGGGYGGGGYGPSFQRMLPLPTGTAVRTDDIPFINVNTPYIRRARVNRERIFAERGRLKQWQ